MTPKDNILKELSELNSSLSLNQQNVYTVAAGYFDGLAAQVLNRIKAFEASGAVEELGHLSPMLGNMTKRVPYLVPQGYFEELAAKALQSVTESNIDQNAKEELASISPLLSGLKKDMSARTGYSDGPFSVPQGYFEELAAKALQSVTESNIDQNAKEELASISPLLSGLKKDMSARTGHWDGPFSVPQGYFESLSENINKEETKPVVKVISLTSRKWFRYAAAAVVAGVIVMAGFLFIGGDTKEPGGKALAKFTRDVKKMNDVQKDDLIDFINAGMSGDETVQVDNDKKSDEVKNLLIGISEEELKDFKEQSEDLEDVLMTN
jgi:hypothetical protein